MTIPAFGGSTGGSIGGMTVPLVIGGGRLATAALMHLARCRRRDSFQNINSLAKAV
jgi:hypothetical protein